MDKVCVNSASELEQNVMDKVSVNSASELELNVKMQRYYKRNILYHWRF